MSPRALRAVCTALALSALTISCNSKSPAPDANTAEPVKPPKELIPGVWHTRLKIDKPAFAKLRAAQDGSSVQEARKEVDKLDAMLESSGMRVQITWQFNSDGTAIVRRKLSRDNDSDNRRHLTWKLVKADGKKATIELTDKAGEKKSRTVTISFQNNNTFRLDDDPELKGLWLAPVLNPVFQRDTDGTDLKTINVAQSPELKLRDIPVSKRWADVDAVLKDAPKTKLEPREFVWNGDTFVMDVPADATIETDEFRVGTIKLKLASGAMAQFFVGGCDMEAAKRGKQETDALGFRIKEFSFSGDDLLIFEYSPDDGKSRPNRFNAYMNVTDGVRMFLVNWFENSSKGSSNDVTLKDCLLLLKCARTFRVKTPYPKDPLQLLSRLKIEFEPRTDDPAKVTRLQFSDKAPYLELVSKFPNVESIAIPLGGLRPKRYDLSPLLACKNLKRFESFRDGAGPDDTDMLLLSKCRSLRELDVLARGAKAKWIPYLSKLTDLTSLKLRDINEKAVGGLIYLSACKELTDLEIDADSFGMDFQGEPAFRFLADLPKLRQLKVSAPITGQTFRVLGRLKMLESLELENDQIQDSHIALLATAPKLKRLAITGATLYGNIKRVKATGATLDKLAGIASLEALSLKRMPVDDEAMKRLQKLKNLRELTIERTAITAKGLMYLKDVPKLRQLHLGRHDTLNSVLIDDFKKAAPHVRVELQ